MGTLVYYFHYTKAVLKAPILIMYGKPICTWAPWLILVETTEAYGLVVFSVIVLFGIIYSRNYLLSVFRLTVSKVMGDDTSKKQRSNKVNPLNNLSSSWSYIKKLLSNTSIHLTLKFWRK